MQMVRESSWMQLSLNGLIVEERGNGQQGHAT